ncbi:hypothetical protein HXX01_03170 [Candidatus Nomurabacteria bacterium]|nr:hypothetical protein [Candidatus Nomurabacteria bacterium]
MDRQEKVQRLRNLRTIKEFSIGMAAFSFFIVLFNMVESTQRNFWVGCIILILLGSYIHVRTNVYIWLKKEIILLISVLKEEIGLTQNSDAE